MQPTKTQAIATFLKAKTHNDLALLYTHDMEVQVNVARGAGKRVEVGDFRGREWSVWSDDFGNQWKPFRIPINANTEPVFVDTVITFSLEQHAEAIGMTGWDWKNRVSRWVAFDFDAIIGHSDKHGKKLSDTELTKVQEVVAEIPFVTLRKSTSGKGLHLYVFLEPVETANHNEHAALARAVLSMLSGITAFDFASKVDVCGGNMWVWARKMYDKDGRQNDGLKLIKAGERLTSIPANWKEHINVITRKARKATPTFPVDASEADKLFEELSGQRTQVTLDSEHSNLINWLSNNNCVWWWDHDNHMLVTHTVHLKEAHVALKLRGSFETNATGADRGFDHNCFCYPLRGGSWVVRRYNPGVQEHSSWDQDGQRWTRTYFNRDADLLTLIRLNGGIEQEKNGYHFRDTASLCKVLTELGITADLPNFVMSRTATLKPIDKDNKIVVSILAEGTDNGELLKGWLLEKKLWKRVFRVNLPSSPEVESNENYDDLVRHLVSMNSQDAGWVLKREGFWVEEPLIHIKSALNYLGHNGNECSSIVGISVLKAWQLVNKPFQPEYPGNREWNRNAAQFAIAPSLNLDALTYPTWSKILNHCGKGLDEAIAGNEWCKSVGITKGSEFLLLWIAALFRKPDQPSTYLAFWGNQDCGKSIFHEMISEILVTSGVVRADTALTSDQAFNGELQSAILCIVEETDLRKDKRAYNRIKDWVTSPELSIHAKHGTPYMTRNYTHWIQCANEQDNCPIFPGDTRITLIFVDDLKPEDLIPKPELMQMLRKEAPDFLAAILHMELPESQDRLCVPTITTEGKKRAEERNMTSLEQFIHEEVCEVPGHCISATEFFEKFLLWMDESERARWTKQRVGRELPERFPRGRLSNNQLVHYGNMSFDKLARPLRPYYSNNLFIKQD